MSSKSEPHPEGQKGNVQRVERIKSQDHLSFYSNDVRLIVTGWDAQLSFSEMHETAINKFVAEAKVTVTIPLETAKALSKILNENLITYEQRFGQIRTINPERPPEQKAET